ncbi:MAG: bifunctional heptose 7-phosphate kinase/heptose 1-phosphate adenyltransferase [Limisphaerales bacterium]
MTPERFSEITDRYHNLRIAVVGDFCLDRYLEIHPARSEISIETGLPVHNVEHVRFQPGGAGTILNNLSALGLAEIVPIGFCGRDAEGHELQEALAVRPGVNLNHFLCTAGRRTFTYCKPLVMHPNGPPEELNRLDFKNWTPTPESVTQSLILALESAVSEVDAVIVLDQVDVADTGVVNETLLGSIGSSAGDRPGVFFIGDSRRGFDGWPPIGLKMNEAEFVTFAGASDYADVIDLIRHTAPRMNNRKQPWFVTRAEHGIVAIDAEGNISSHASLPVHGEIDIVGAGDAVTANLTAAIAAGASPAEAAILANRAASVVIHKLGTTGTASVEEIAAAE